MLMDKHPFVYDKLNNDARRKNMRQYFGKNATKMLNNNSARVAELMTDGLPPKVSYVKQREQRELYQEHRQRMANIKGKVNSYLPPPKVKLEGMRMDLSYMEMMTKLYRKSENTTRTFSKSPERLAFGRMRNANVARAREKAKDEESQQFIPGGQLVNPYTNSMHRRRPHRKVKAFSYEIPMHVLHRYENLVNKCDIGMLCKLLRPQIYFDVVLKAAHPIKQRIVIQLFTEACPQIVLELMRICSSGERRRIKFTRVFAPLWIEGRIAMDENKPIAVDCIEHDFDVLNHGVDAGILSFPSRYIRGSKLSSLSFTISFKPLSILNGKRIAFGKIRKGLSLLERIQFLATQSGKPLRGISLKDYGVILSGDEN